MPISAIPESTQISHPCAHGLKEFLVNYRHPRTKMEHTLVYRVKIKKNSSRLVGNRSPAVGLLEKALPGAISMGKTFVQDRANCARRPEKNLDFSLSIKNNNRILQKKFIFLKQNIFSYEFGFSCVKS